MASIEIAKEIIKKAREANQDSKRYFNYYDHETEDMEMKNIYWTRCMEYDGMTNAYLVCYELITEIKVKNLTSEIEREYYKYLP